MKVVLAIMGLLASAVAQNLPQLPTDWSAVISDQLVVNQGGVSGPDGSTCCPAMSPECKVQTEFQEGKQYFSFTTNRTAFKNPDNSGVVTLYNLAKEFAVDADGNCQSYCPLGNEEDQLFPLGYGENATATPGTYMGKPVTVVVWKQEVFGITMQTSTMYVDTSGSANAPVAEIDQITPFGIPLGMENTTYAAFQGGAQPSTAFTVKNISSCPMSNQCQGDDDGNSGFDDDQGPPRVNRGIRMPSGRYSVLAAQVMHRPRPVKVEAEAKLHELGIDVDKMLSMMPNNLALDRSVLADQLLERLEN